MNTIAILGATSHIAKGLIYSFAQHLADDDELRLYARTPDRVVAFLKTIGANYPVFPLTQFSEASHSVIINCIGFGQPVKLKSGLADVFRLTEAYDNLILDYQQKNPEALYINFSSGAVYGATRTGSAQAGSSLNIAINPILPQDYYLIAKLNAEAKHRAHSQFNIADIRVFAYFSRFIDLDAGYFITELLRCIKTGQEFITDSTDMIRDYCGMEDVFQLVRLILKKRQLNDAFDLYSCQPVSKFELIHYFAKIHGLNYTVQENNGDSLVTVTGAKNVYYSEDRKLAELGYVPEFTSLGLLKKEGERLLSCCEKIGMKL